MRVTHTFCDHCKKEIEREGDVLDVRFCMKNPDAEYPNPLEIYLHEEVCSISCAMVLITDAIEKRQRKGKSKGHV